MTPSDPKPAPARTIVRRCANSFEAAFLKGYLEEHGIEAWDGSESERAWTGRYGTLSRGVALKVRTTDAASARRLLENPPEALREEPAPEENAPEGGNVPICSRCDTPPAKCPNCGSENIVETAGTKVFWLLGGLLLLGIPFLLGSRPRRGFFCRDCDWDSLR